MAQTNRYITTAKNSVKKERLTVILLSAMPGKRMKGRGNKSLLQIDDNTNVIEKQVKTIYRMYNDADIIVSVGFQDNKIRNYIRWVHPVRLAYNPLYETKGVVYSIALAMNATVPGNLLIIHGDIVFNAFALSGLTSTPFSKILIDKKGENPDDVGLVSCDNKVTNMSYGLPDKWGQMVYIHHRDMAKFENLVFDYDNYGHLLLYEIINKMIDRGVSFVPFSPSRTKLVEIKNVEDLTKARNV